MPVSPHNKVMTCKENFREQKALLKNKNQTKAQSDFKMSLLTTIILLIPLFPLPHGFSGHSSPDPAN